MSMGPVYMRLLRMDLGLDWCVQHHYIFSQLTIDKITAHLQNWCNGFAQHAMETVKMLIDQNKEVLKTKEDITMNINAYLKQVPAQEGSNLSLYAYQYCDWNNGPLQQSFALNLVVLQTFALTHLASLGDSNDMNYRPVRALLLAMQAVGCALEYWKTGEKPGNKPQPFLVDNYGDYYIEAKKNNTDTKSKVPTQHV
ncbi:hypothetical protein APHAL10511_008633 [Amanita phalloides]|nr:hypothetical protein APHAL10511_008633 [Amanita phalloides]